MQWLAPVPPAGLPSSMIALDTETTGLDVYHGSRPYFVTIADSEASEDERVVFWEWDVDPLTREVHVPEDDLLEICSYLENEDYHVPVVGQNIKFDVSMLSAIGIGNWKWEVTHDTLIASHLLTSLSPHDLTALAFEYLGRNIKPFEDELKEATLECRRRVQQARLARKRGKRGPDDDMADWCIAEGGLPDMPSADWGYLKADGWLPRAVARRDKLRWDHKYWHVLREYANTDSECTLHIWQKMERELHRRKLWKNYENLHRKLPHIALRMEAHGITVNESELNVLREEYAAEAEKAGREILGVALSAGMPDFTLPKSGNNQALRTLVFDVLKLPPVKYSEKTQEPSLDKETLEFWSHSLPEGSAGLKLVEALQAKRKRDTAVSYMDGYKRFWLPYTNGALPNTPAMWMSRHKYRGWYVLHPSLNITGTSTLRWSSSNPNEQNISKQKGFNLRRCFGPAPGREWWSLDYQNLELRIPAFEAGETDLIEVFSHPDKPPYYGSYHLVIFDVLHPDLFKQFGAECKTEFESTWYQWVKNGNFAVLYGCQERQADRTYHVKGAFQKIRHRFPKMAALSDRMIQIAKREGQVYTIPDKYVDPDQGYPLMTSWTEFGEVEPTKPLNYHVSGTAMQCTDMAMVRCQDALDFYREAERFDGHMVIQAHDELVFDFPRGSGGEPWRTNERYTREMARLMELSGEGIGVPTPVSIEYHPKNWAEGSKV